MGLPKYRGRYKEKIKEYNRKWRKSHPNYNSEYYKLNKSEINKRNERNRNKPEYKERAKARLKYRLDEAKRKVYDLLGRECVHCGFDDVRALQIDHINGGGTKDRKGMSGLQFLNHVISINGKGYQILCANCNWIKRYENGENKKRTNI